MPAGRPGLASSRGSDAFSKLAGDLTHARERQSLKGKQSTFLSACAAIAPTFYALGNHEFSFTEEDLALARQSGAVLLLDEYVSHGPLCIGGLTSRTRPARLSHRRKTVPPRLDWLSDFERQPGYKLLINHHPEYYRPYLKARNIDLILSGHAHGGQFRLPFIGGLYAPGQGILPDYDSGLYTEGRTDMIVSRGIGNSAFPIRFNNRPEVILIELKCG